jgi:drug/metabolite transporter (DMT)-like permease
MRSDALLLLAAVIWGGGFVAQRAGMEHVGPFTFNGVRFLLACLVLLPVAARRRYTAGQRGEPRRPAPIRGGCLAGLLLFSGSSLQQLGMVSTTAGKAGFITGLYVVFVPILGLLWKQRTGAGTWVGTLLAAGGLYLLSVTKGFSMASGDLLVLAGAVVWAGHVLTIGWLSPGNDPIELALTQFAFCAVASLAAAFCFETVDLRSIADGTVPIIYGGVFSVGIAFTLQVVAQRHCPPAHTAILLSLEAVFAALGGWILLDETIGSRGLCGCALMLAGMLLSQLWAQLPSLRRQKG